MTNTQIIVGILIAIVFVLMTVFVLFGQVTVRKLRKNPETKNDLGMELVSGWDIINVAQSLAMPAALLRIFRTSKLSFLYADPDVFIKHTNIFDRILARLFYWTMMSTGLFLAGWALLDVTGMLQ